MTVVHLVRHGEVYNPEHVLYGRLPGFHLSRLGHSQARLVADYLAPRDLRYLVSSPLERARQTAEPLAQASGLSLDVDERLIEAASKLEGRLVAGGRGLFRDPRNYRYFVNPLRPSWGEPYVEIAARVLAAARAARDAAQRHGGSAEAVCISHQLPIVVARRRVRHQRLFHDPRRRNCALASVTSLTFEGDSVVEVSYHEPAADLPGGRGAGA